MAMVMLNIGILAIVAAFNSGDRRAQAREPDLDRRRRSPTRRWSSTARSPTPRSRSTRRRSCRVDNTYKCDTALGGSCPNSTSGEVTKSCTGLPNECNPSRTATGADRKNYRVDTYITSSTPTGGRALKLVTVVVRDGTKLSARPLARVASTFDASTAG